MERQVLEEQLKTVSQSLFYLTLIILSVLLSFRSVLIQREELEDLAAGKSPGAAPDVFPIKRNASVLVVGALGFFFCLSLRTCREAARGNDPAARQSAEMNVWASFFVLAAALIRLWDLGFMEAVQRAAAAEEERSEDRTPRPGGSAGGCGPFTA